MCLIAGLARCLPVPCPLCTLVVHSEWFSGADLSGNFLARSRQTAQLPPLFFSQSPDKCCENDWQEHNDHLQPCQVGVCHRRHHPHASRHIWHWDKPWTSKPSWFRTCHRYHVLQCRSTPQQSEEGDSGRPEELPDQSWTRHLDQTCD